MTCEQTRDLLDRYVAGALVPEERADIERHVQDCAACRADLEAAAALAAPVAGLSRQIPPPADLWPGIARRITPPAWRRRTLAAAAALFLMAGSSLLTIAVLRRGTAPQTVISASPAVVQLIDAEYAPRAQALEAILAGERDKLAPATIATVERNLAVIDRAIAESRAALARDPGNPDLRALFRTSQAQKVALLEQATRLAHEL
ncbi:MAG TPA: zf-HC2 domain-containing protein [Gemmatimonadales bacterium]|nr:zf-HC2 domain-containing protein [Gemmatimonadales bacterium]